jgi:hippurate hydrolase
LNSFFVHFYQNPELSIGEVKTAKPKAQEPNALGFKVREGIGQTSIVAILKNSGGAMLMILADINRFLIKKESGLPCSFNH